MNTFLQPKNALQRADELCNVGQELEAFELLQRTILDRKFRYLQWDALAQQEVVAHFVRLGVKLDKIKQCRDGLLHYRNHCQHGVAMMGALEKVIFAFRNAAEAQVVAQTPPPPSDGGMITTRGAESDPALRICIDSYRIIIDLIKSTPRLGAVYHSTIIRAHTLCRRYLLRQDFRRLADLVRSNYHLIMKQKLNNATKQANVAFNNGTSEEDLDDLKRPEVHIVTRLSQLKTAIYLEAWKEAQTTIEELFSLGILDFGTLRNSALRINDGQRKNKASPNYTSSQKASLLVCLSQYFQLAAELFRRANFPILHALCYTRWFLQSRNAESSADRDETQILSSLAVLATLAIPIEEHKFQSAVLRTPKEEERKRLAGLVGHAVVPTRAQLVKLLNDKAITPDALPSVKQLLQEVEGGYTRASTVADLLETIQADFRAYTDRLPVPVASAEGVVGAAAPGAAGKEVFVNYAIGETGDAKNFQNNVTMPQGLATIASNAGDVSTEDTVTCPLQAAQSHFDGIRRSVLRKSIIDAARIYECLSMEKFTTAFCPPQFMPWTQAERELAQAEQACGVDIKIDFAGGVIRLNCRETANSHLESRKRMANLSSALYKIILERKQGEREARNLEGLQSIRENSQALLEYWESERMRIAAKKREELANLQRLLSESRKDADRERALIVAETEAARSRAVAAELEAGRKGREVESARLQCATLAIEKIRLTINALMEGSTSSHLSVTGQVTTVNQPQIAHCRQALQNFKINGIHINDLTPEILVNQRLTFQQVQQAMDNAIKEIMQASVNVAKEGYKKHDYFARAVRAEKLQLIRTEEIPRIDQLMDARHEAITHERDRLLATLTTRNKIVDDNREKIQEYWQAHKDDLCATKTA